MILPTLANYVTLYQTLPLSLAPIHMIRGRLRTVVMLSLCLDFVLRGSGWREREREKEKSKKKKEGKESPHAYDRITAV